jgi:hypothetical protein
MYDLPENTLIRTIKAAWKASKGDKYRSARRLC